MNSNPLQTYFRQPAIHIRLPSQGQFYAPGAIDIPANGEFPVLPMTTLDEITYRTPDSLFNGSAIVNVIQSCLPNIKNAWSVPGMDIDPILIAIRIATYGHELTIETTCPNCGTERGYGVDLRVMLDKITTPDYGAAMQLGDLEIYLKPMSYQQMNANNMAQFEEQKMLQAMQNPDLPAEQRANLLGDALKKITAVTTNALCQNIRLIKTPTAQVTEETYIHEWLTNADRATFARVRDYIIQNKKRGEMPGLDLSCLNCGHEYEQAVTLDVTNFFGAAS